MSCQVRIDGTTYYVPCDKVQDLELINNQLVNTGSASITLKSSFALTGNTYPYISCSSNSVCRLYRSTGQEYIAVTSAPVLLSDPFLTYKHDYLITCLLLILIGVKLIWKK